jgi:hypothetical protein
LRPNEISSNRERRMQTRNKWISDGLTSPPRWAAAARGGGGEGGTKEEQRQRREKERDGKELVMVAVYIEEI